MNKNLTVGGVFKDQLVKRDQPVSGQRDIQESRGTTGDQPQGSQGIPGPTGATEFTWSPVLILS